MASGPRPSGQRRGFRRRCRVGVGEVLWYLLDEHTALVTPGIKGDEPRASDLHHKREPVAAHDLAAIAAGFHVRHQAGHLGERGMAFRAKGRPDGVAELPHVGLKFPTGSKAKLASPPRTD